MYCVSIRNQQAVGSSPTGGSNQHKTIQIAMDRRSSWCADNNQQIESTQSQAQLRKSAALKRLICITEHAQPNLTRPRGGPCQQNASAR
jgi:hypothetical protein